MSWFCLDSFVPALRNKSWLIWSPTFSVNILGSKPDSLCYRCSALLMWLQTEKICKWIDMSVFP
jgi:hypothetical protein